MAFKLIKIYECDNCSKTGVSLRKCRDCGQAVCKNCRHFQEGTFFKKILGNGNKHICEKCAAIRNRKAKGVITEAFKTCGAEKLQSILNKVFIVEAMANEEGS